MAEMNSCIPEKCTGCGICIKICPVQCLTMEVDVNGFEYPARDEKRCTGCGICVKNCPINSLYYSYDIQTYAARAKNEEIVEASSSGGLFSVFAKAILEEGGIVFGAVFDSELNVTHKGITSEEQLHKLQKSKYVQSSILSILEECHSNLEAGRKVLFAGTPCQVAGLKSYLKKDYENLYLVDLICHGVPNNKVWHSYLKYVEEKKGKKIKHYSFRDKSKENIAVNSFASAIFYTDGEKEIIPLRENLYFQAFSKNLSLRESCYNCQFKGLQSGSDITLGDYWGIENEHPDFASSKGNSIVITSTEKGKKIFESIADECDVVDTTINKISSHNTIFISPQKPKLKDEFWKSFDNEKAWTNIDFLQLDEAPYGKFKIGLYGSYNSRVSIVESGNTLEFQYSNTGIISQMDERKISWDFQMPDNNFRKKMMQADLERTFNNCNFDNIDFLVIDFLEERFHIGNADGSYFTLSDAFSDMNKWEGKELAIGNREFLTLWKERCNLFIHMLEEKIEKPRVMLCKMYLTDTVGLNTKISQAAWKPEADSINKIIDEMYSYFIERYNPKYIIQIQEKYNFCHKFHLYGCLSQHLNYKAYFDLASQINGYIKESNYERRE